jgi:hypothetical protein
VSLIVGQGRAVAVKASCLWRNGGHCSEYWGIVAMVRWILGCHVLGVTGIEGGHGDCQNIVCVE